jgi:muramoyltetrapeptide carboxypeptidase
MEDSELKKVAIFAPSSRLTEDEQNRATACLRERFGLTLQILPSVMSKLSPEDKAQEFLSAAFNDSFDWLLCARGGEGCADILPFLNPFKSKFKNALVKKRVLGMSDSTPLLLFLSECGWPVWYGHVASFFSRPLSPVTRQSFKRFLTYSSSSLELTPLNSSAKALDILESTVVGGNLTLLSLSLKETWELNPSGKILFIEDWNEKPYAIDRTFKHLERVGFFYGIQALILGDFVGNLPSSQLGLTEVERLAIESVLIRLSERMPCPVFSARTIGHVQDIQPILLGPGKILQSNGSWMMEC